MNKLLIAKHHKTLENPYHFWLGYLLPIINELKKDVATGDGFIVRECGPMTNWLQILKNKYNIKILKPGIVLKYYLDGAPTTIFDYWDDPDNFNKKDFINSINLAKSFYIIDNVKKTNKVCVLNRNTILDFYNSGEEEMFSSGNKTRLIKNIKELHSSILKYYNCELIDTTKTQPRISATKYSEFSVLIGQKGAGLTNMIWMDSGSLIIEICAPEQLFSQKLDTCYESLANAIGHKFIRVFAQNEWDGNVNIDSIISLLKKEIKDNK